MEKLRIYHLVESSLANGPGDRAVVWVQGCTLACPGCFNAPTHPHAGGEVWEVDALFERLAALRDIEGVTFSGGEPLQQPKALLALLRRIRRETTLSVVLFTGFAWEEVQGLADAEELLGLLDALLAGRYQAERRVARHLLGSENKTLHCLSDRYVPEDFQRVPPGEIHILSDGSVLLSGIDPVSLS